MLRVWEEINSLEDAQNGEEDDDSSMVVSPDAFAIACFQNGLYADPEEDEDDILEKIRSHMQVLTYSSTRLVISWCNVV